MNTVFKKVLYLSLVFIIFTSNFCFADDFLEEVQETDYIETATETTEEPTINSKHVAVIDRKTLTILYEKNAYKKTPMASTTKIMTCILALENCELNETITVSKKAASIHGSTLGLKKDSQISMIDLLYGLMLRSGNDCAIAVAEHISGSVEEFSKLMNKKAIELNLLNSNFVTPHGLDDDNHYTTAYELAILTDYALKNETFKKIVSSKNQTIMLNGAPRTLSNTNELLGNVEGVYGVKTGFTFNAGRCLVSSCKRNELDIIVVVLGSDTKKIRTTDSKKLINYVFNNFEYYDTYSLLEKNFNSYLEFFNKNVILKKTTEMPVIELSELENYIYPLTKKEILDLNTKVFTITNFSPLNFKDEKIGYITIYTKNKILCSTDILLKNDLTPNSWNFYFNNIIKNYFKSILFI